MQAASAAVGMVVKRITSGVAGCVREAHRGGGGLVETESPRLHPDTATQIAAAASAALRPRRMLRSASPVRRSARRREA